MDNCFSTTTHAESAPERMQNTKIILLFNENTLRTSKKVVVLTTRFAEDEARERGLLKKGEFPENGCILWKRGGFCEKMHFWIPEVKRYRNAKEYQWFWGTFSNKSRSCTDCLYFFIKVLNFSEKCIFL